MKLLDFLVADATVEELQATDKEPVVQELVGKLVEAGKIRKKDAAAVVKAIMDREALGSTGIGRGIAVPHAKHAAVKDPVGCFGRSVRGINFSAIDGEPVFLVFLLVSPPDQPGAHLKALEHISVVLRDENFSRFLRRAKDRADLVSLLAEADEKFYRG
jgi:mannitol/fructose-specific phosphotransferase system IIA component (Ntr-type)